MILKWVGFAKMLLAFNNYNKNVINFFAK